MSAVMLMIAMALTVKVLGWVGAERRAWDRRQWAAQEAANLMEQVDRPGPSRPSRPRSLKEIWRSRPRRGSCFRTPS